MTALALSVAAVLVAIIARDVAIRALVDRARERGTERADVKRIETLEALVKRGEEWRVRDVARFEHALGGLMNARVEKLETDVEALKARDQMAALAKKAGR